MKKNQLNFFNPTTEKDIDFTHKTKQNKTKFSKKSKYTRSKMKSKQKHSTLVFLGLVIVQHKRRVIDPRQALL